MNHRNTMLILWIFVLIPFSMIMGCSRGASTVIPDDATYNSLPAIADAGQIGMSSERQLQGIFQIDFTLEDVENLIDQSIPIELIGCRPQAQTLGIEVPNMAGVLVGERTADLHLNVRPFIATPLIYIRSWNPTTETLDLDVFIRNTSIYNGYDIRLIIFRDTIGHKLLNPDNYTHLWDIPEGTWSNGFIAYAKDNDHRILHAGEFRWERVQILCPGGNFSIKFAIDASWPSNCEEPYMMNNFTQGMLQAYLGATSDITVDVFDWQDNVDSVRIQCSTITGETDTYMTNISGTKWGVELVNNNAVPEGDYFALIAATSAGSIDPLIHIVNVTVSPEVGNGYALTWGGTGNEYGYDIAIDSDGNIIIAGTFTSPSVDFNPDPVEEDIHTSVNGYETAFISKFDSHGDFLWAQTWGTAGTNTYNEAVGVNSVGEIFAGGSTDEATVSAYLIKFDADGNQLWDGHWGDGNLDRIICIAIDNNDNVIVGGRFVGTVDFDPGPGTDIQTSNGDDPYVIKFDSDCNHIWARHWGGAGIDFLEGVTTDSIGSVITCGFYWLADADFDPGPGTDIRVNNGEEDAFVHKLDANGNYLWVGTWGDHGEDIANDCAVDEFDDVYVVGSFYYTVDFNQDPIEVEERTAVWYNDGFVSKFDVDGDFLWVFALGGDGRDRVRKITTNQNMNIIVAGDSWNIDFDPSPNEYIRTGSYIANYDYDMSLNWVNTWETLGWLGLTTDSINNIYSSGGFGGRVDFDPGEGKYEISPAGSNDAYLMKILPNGLWE